MQIDLLGTMCSPDAPSALRISIQKISKKKRLFGDKKQMISGNPYKIHPCKVRDPIHTIKSKKINMSFWAQKKLQKKVHYAAKKSSKIYKQSKLADPQISRIRSKVPYGV